MFFIGIAFLKSRSGQVQLIDHDFLNVPWSSEISDHFQHLCKPWLPL
ncbi:Uncharacterized protein AC517_4991 [Pseudomonas syringae pv. syringae]|nr:Uncharacterized protein AC517_4991 [Pseudomonas syringae pv. syringae]